jgi:hypothetical protein
MSGWDMIDYQRDQAMWHITDGKIRIAKLQAEVMKLTRELGGQMVSEDVRAHHAFWAKNVMPPWDVEHEGHEIKIREDSLLIDGIDHVIEWRDSDIECPLSYAEWLIAGKDRAKWRYQPMKIPDTLAEIRAVVLHFHGYSRNPSLMRFWARTILNRVLEKYRPGRSEPILIGSEKLLKPALKLMIFYRLRIDEIREDAVVTSYIRRLESVQVKGASALA